MRKRCVEARKDANVKPPGNSLSAFYAIFALAKNLFPSWSFSPPKTLEFSAWTLERSLQKFPFIEFYPETS